MTEETPASLEAFEDFKDRLKALGWSQRDFAEYIGVHGSTMGKWRGSIIPLYAIRLVDEMERHVVSPAWRGGKGRADPTSEDARDALRRATTTTVDEAIKRGWSRAQIAGALRSFADETEGTKRGG